VEACPQTPKALEMIASLEDGLEKVFTPRLNFKKNNCALCSKCADACPNGTLVPLPVNKIKLGTNVKDISQCSSWNGGKCNWCATICPYNATQLVGGIYPTVIPELCKGCGKCNGCSLNTVINKGEIRRET